MGRALLAVAVAACIVAAGAAPDAPKPQAYYLALGDSLAYGMQPDKNDKGLPPSRFDTGFVDVFAARLQKLTPKLRVVNFGCPGESTVTYVRGGCPWLAEKRKLHDPFHGAQQHAALAFLAAHPGQVSPITMTLFGNDVFPAFESCHEDLTCVKRKAPAAIKAFSSRLAAILGKLRTAAPGARILLTGAWNIDPNHLADARALYSAANAAMAKVAAGAGARYANVLPIFNPPGSAAKTRARLCAYTFICSRGDPHPTDAGYRAIAAVLFASSGY